MAKLFKFELVEGIHSVSEGQYIHAAKSGEAPVIVVSGDRLDVVFGETKFKYVGDVEDPATPEVAPEVAPEDKKGKK